jgi:hypothetical protein
VRVLALDYPPCLTISAAILPVKLKEMFVSPANKARAVLLFAIPAKCSYPGSSSLET